MTLEFSELNIESRKLIDLALNIYSVLRDKDLSFTTENGRNNFEEHPLVVQDKKALSILLASTFIQSNLKDLYDDYEGFNLEEICEYVGVKSVEVKAATEYSRYRSSSGVEQAYTRILKFFIGVSLDAFEESYAIIDPDISPEVLMLSLFAGEKKAGSKVLGYFLKDHSNIFYITGQDHPLVATLKMDCMERKLIEKIQYNNSKPSQSSIPLRQSLTMSLFKGFEKETSLDKEVIEEIKKVKEKTPKIPIWDKLEGLLKKYIGQEGLTEELFYSVYNNIKLSEKEKVESGERAIMFIDGPSGTGKTAISSDIAKIMDVPYVIVPITSFSAAGYVGNDLDDILKKLYDKAEHDIEKAQRGIVIIDEFDKIAMHDEKDIRMKNAVQDQLLDFLGGGKYTLSSGSTIFSPGTKTDFDTSKLTFICLGAITNVRNSKTDRSKTIGFISPEEKDDAIYYVNPKDLEEMGLQKELVGRINTFLHTEDYDKEVLERILRESPISPLETFKRWAKDNGKSIIIDDDVYGLIASYAYDLDTGARSLQTVVNTIKIKLMKAVFRGEAKEIHLDAETVKSSFEKTVQRKKRG